MTEEHRLLLDKIVRNHGLLDACDGPHDFEAFQFIGEVPVPRRFRCRKCGGEIDNDQHRWYARGLEHGTRGQGERPAVGGADARGA